MGNASALGTGSLTIFGGALVNGTPNALTLAGSLAQTWAGDFAVAGNASLNLGAAPVLVTQDLTLTVNTPVLEVGGTLFGSATLTKAGNGTLILTGQNALSGGIRVLGGTVLLNSGSSVGAAALQTPHAPSSARRRCVSPHNRTDGNEDDQLALTIDNF